MASEMMEALISLAQEKHIDELYLLDRLEQSLAKSYADILDLDWGAKVTIDRQTGNVYVYKLVPKDDSMVLDEEDPLYGTYTEFDEIDVTPKDTSRIAAQHAKAEINAIVRNAAREQIYEEFSKRIGELITGTVLQTTPDFTILKIREGVEAELPHFDKRRNPDEMNERPNGEYYQHNQRIRAVIVGVRDPKAAQNGTAVRGEHNRPAIIVSRTHPDLIRRLFELEVPEVYDGVVEVKAISREPGTRSKVAVASLDSHLDPVGACVGPKGSRVRMVVSELRGERIDVVLWDNDQLSLAIGKEGQNARLAARLTGWHIDIKNESLAANVMGTLTPLMDETVTLEEDGQCQYVDASGVRCRNQARPGSCYCSLHQGTKRRAHVEEEDDGIESLI